MCAVWISGNKRLLRIDKTKVANWIRFMGVVTFWRFVLFKIFAFGSLFGNSLRNASIIPWPVAFTVFWEDAVFAYHCSFLRKK